MTFYFHIVFISKTEEEAFEPLKPFFLSCDPFFCSVCTTLSQWFLLMLQPLILLFTLIITALVLVLPRLRLYQHFLYRPCYSREKCLTWLRKFASGWKFFFFCLTLWVKLMLKKLMDRHSGLEQRGIECFFHSLHYLSFRMCLFFLFPSQHGKHWWMAHQGSVAWYVPQPVVFKVELPEILTPESAVSKRQERWRVCGYCESWL